MSWTSFDLYADLLISLWTSYWFSSFLLFFGRVVDLYSAKDVFCHGFVAVGVLNLIISFLPDKVCLFIFAVWLC